MWEKRIGPFYINTKIVIGILLITLVPFLLMLYSKEAKADGWVIIPGLSHHVNTTTKHNERNYGIGYEWSSDSGRRWVVEAYDNSYWKAAVAVMTEVKTFDVADNFKFRLMGGAVTGYKYPVTPGFLPVWTYEKGRFGFDALTIPSIHGRMGIYAIQFKVRF